MTGRRNLFVYGTLAPQLAPPHLRDITSRMKLIGPATVAGRLYDLGEYPIVILGGLTTCVYGKVFELSDDPEIWGRLDAYEGFDPALPMTGVFRRVTCTADLDADRSQIACEIYTATHKPPMARLILDGEWRPGAQRWDGQVVGPASFMRFQVDEPSA